MWKICARCKTPVGKKKCSPKAVAIAVKCQGQKCKIKASQMSWAESIKWAKCRKGESGNGSLKCER